MLLSSLPSVNLKRFTMIDRKNVMQITLCLKVYTNRDLAVLLTKLCGGAAPTPLPEGYYPSGLPLLLRASPFGADAEQKWDSQGAMSLGRGLGQSPNINPSETPPNSGLLTFEFRTKKGGAA